jgi:hypothetical protein
LAFQKKKYSAVPGNILNGNSSTTEPAKEVQNAKVENSNCVDDVGI